MGKIIREIVKKIIDAIAKLGNVEIDERGYVDAVYRIARFRDEDGAIERMSKAGASIEEIIAKYPDRFINESRFERNVFLNEGIQQIWDDVCGLATVTKWDNANARVGVGDDSATAEDATQTGLIGTNTAFASMDSGYPTRTDQTVDFRGTFGGTEANFAWEEFTVDNGATDDINLCRKLSSQGTKTSGQTWILTISLTIA